MSQRIRALSSVLFQEAVAAHPPDAVQALVDFAEDISTAREGFLIFDQSGCIILCNKAFVEIFNIPVSPLGFFVDAVFRRIARCRGSSTPIVSILPR